MTVLTAAARKKIPASKFALPGGRYPVEDKPHAANAKARASEMYHKGKLSGSEKATVDRKADAVLGKPRDHSLAKASASHLAAMGHISGAKRDAIHRDADAKLAKAKKAPKPYGAMAPMNDHDGDDDGNGY